MRDEDGQGDKVLDGILVTKLMLHGRSSREAEGWVINQEVAWLGYHFRMILATVGGCIGKRGG